MMNYKANTKAILILLITVLVGCGKSAVGTYNYDALKNVTYIVNTKKLKHHSDIKSVFLYFELTINNKSSEEVYIDIGKIQANLNGELSSATHYDSLASAMPDKEKLEQGQSVQNLYFVFSENLLGQKLNEFKITNYGLSKQ